MPFPAGGTTDILGARRGALVPNDNLADFALAVVNVLGNDELRRRLAREGLDYSYEWSDQALAGHMAELYYRIVNQRQECPA